MLTEMIRTDRTYATRINAIKALEKATKNYEGQVRYVIATTEEGRYAPVVYGVEMLPLAHQGITVIG